MELKYTNPNCKIILTIKINQVDLCLYVKIELKNNSHLLFFEKDALTKCKIRCFVISMLQIQMEWIKAFYEDKNIINKD